MNTCTGRDIKRLRIALGMSVAQFARMLHVAEYTVFRWQDVEGDINATGIVGAVLRHCVHKWPASQQTTELGARLRRDLDFYAPDVEGSQEAAAVRTFRALLIASWG